MCVIAVKNKNSRMFTEEELKNCWENNPDGAGFLYTKKNKVVCDKGYMTYKSFKKHYDYLCRKFNNFDNKVLILHFRIGTSGSNSPENTHPYILTNNIVNLHSLYTTGEVGLVHNGIISDYEPPINNTKNMSDTQIYIRDYLFTLYLHWKDFYKNKNMKDAIEKMTNSKFAFLDKNGNVEIVGDFIDNKGILYSNSSYKKYEYIPKYSSKNWWDEYNCNYSYNDFKNKNELNKNDNLQKLDKNYFVEYSDGNFEEVGEEKLYLDYNTGYLYDINLQLIDYAPIIYDSNFEVVF